MMRTSLSTGGRARCLSRSESGERFTTADDEITLALRAAGVAVEDVQRCLAAETPCTSALRRMRRRKSCPGARPCGGGPAVF